jgi:hypothetical protein
MILIYSKEIDDFVNQVIDGLKSDSIRMGDSDILSLGDVNITNKSYDINVFGEYFQPIDLNSINSMWFIGGFASTEGSSYENNCFSMLVNSFLQYKDVEKIGRFRGDFECNKLDISLEAKNQGLKIPETLLTNDKQKLLSFYNKFTNQNGIICKRITDQYLYATDDYKYDFNLTSAVDSIILEKIPSQVLLLFL